jgi:lipoteichoic acid synthase
MNKKQLLPELVSLLVPIGTFCLKLYHVQAVLSEATAARPAWLLATAAALLVLISAMILLRPLVRTWTWLLSNLLLTAVLMIDLICWRYWHELPSLHLLREATLAKGVSSSVTALLKWGDLWYVADIAILSLLLASNSVRSFLGQAPRLKRRISLALASLLLVVAAAMNSTVLAKLEAEQSAQLALQTSKRTAQQVGLLHYHAMDAWRYLAKHINRVQLTSADWQQVTEHFHQQQVAAAHHHGLLEGKNLVMVQLEAFQAFVLQRTINGQEITPNLNRLAESSLRFDQTYYQTAWGGTSDAEFLANVSMLPAKEGSAYYQFAGNRFSSLAQTLNEAGYHTVSMHANAPDFWNRASMHQSLGFQDYQNIEHFDIDERFLLGLTDHSFYRQAVEKMRSYRQPFYAFLISLSSHFPFKDETNPLPATLDVGKFADTLMGDYLQSIHFADQAVGVLVDELVAAGFWDNSLVVFYGDHAAIPYEQRSLLGQLVYGRDSLTQLEWFQQQRVPLLIHLPQEQFRGSIKIAAGQIDIYPTVANLLGVSAPFALGNDLLNTEGGFVCFRNNMWVTDQVMYLGTPGLLYSLESGELLNMEEYGQHFDEAANTVRVSDLTLEHDLLDIISTRLSDE